jgi:hypothetical protein
VVDSFEMCICGVKNAAFTIIIAENILNVDYLQMPVHMNVSHFMLIRTSRRICHLH